MSDERLQRAAIVLAAIAAAALGSAALARGSLLPAAAVVGVAGLVIALREPRLAIVALLGAIAFLPERFGRVSLAGIDTDVVEVLGFTVLAVWLVRAGSGLGHRRSALRLPVALLLLGTAVGAVVALAGGTELAPVIGSAKVFALYALPLALASLLPDGSRPWLADQVVRLATAGAALIVAYAAVGRPPPGTRTYLVVTLDTVSEAQRLRPPAMALVFLATLIVAHRLATRGPSAARLVTLAILLAAQGLSFYRSTWVPMALALAAFFLLRPGRRTPFRGFVTGATVLVVALVLYLAASNGSFGDTGRALALRVASIGNSDVLEESSLDDRTEEWEDAARALRRSPVVGVGIGAPYGALRSVYDLDLNRRVYAQRLYIHNSWLGAWLRLGLLGVAGFALLLRAVWREGVRARRELPTEAASLALVGVLAVYGFALQALFQTTLTDRATIVALACATALVELRPARVEADQALVTTRSST